MRKITSRDQEKGKYFTANPHESRVLLQQENIVWSELGGGESGGEDADHVRSLKSLVDHHLEPPSFPRTPMSFFDSPFLPVYYPNTHNYVDLKHYPNYGVDHKGLIRDLQAAFQSVGESYGELRMEIDRAIRKGSTPLLSAADAAYPLSKLLHELVLKHLRELGVNAGICKSQRDSEKKSQRPSFPTEEYEYMDVIQSDKGAQTHASERVIIDLRFRSQFEIARPSAAYVDLLKVVPAAYVGPPDVLQKALKLLSEAIKRSLESQGMPLPPWRRDSFLYSKWLSPLYSRSISALPSTNLKHIIKKPSTKRETFLCSTHKSINLLSSPLCSLT